MTPISTIDSLFAGGGLDFVSLQFDCFVGGAWAVNASVGFSAGWLTL
ncbi:hypothetical protein [Burkholderia ubonensis]|nr:hypothetical protein [Burkholderia ubonensis]